MRPTPIRARWLPLSLLPLAACGGGDDTPARPVTAAKVTVEVPTPEAGSEPGAPEDARPADVRGSVFFPGDPPARKELVFGSQPGCNIEREGPPLSESLLIHDGRIENCIVYISKGLPRNYKAPAAPEADVEFTQHGCVYAPHVTAARVGQKLVFHNEDPTSHNVRIASKFQGFNQTQAANGQDIVYPLERAEPPVRIGCDIHSWMRAWVGVFDHPFFAVTGPDGTYSIAELPPGSYELVCWHESLGKKTAKIELPAGGVATVDFTY